MTAIYCANCQMPIEQAGCDYRGETRWEHRGGNIQCQMFARPTSDDLAGGRRRLICPRCKGFADDPAVLHSPQGCYGIGSLRTDLKETP